MSDLYWFCSIIPLRNGLLIDQNNADIFHLVPDIIQKLFVQDVLYIME